VLERARVRSNSANCMKKAAPGRGAAVLHLVVLPLGILLRAAWYERF
jgi:hypothetical protein